MTVQSKHDAHTTDGEDTSGPGGREADHARMERRKYLRFAAMIATSTVVMFC